VRTVNRAEAANGANVPYTTLITGRYHGERKPAVVGSGRAKERWSVPQVLAARLAKICEAKYGVPLSALTELINVYWTASEADLLNQFRAGRRYVMVVCKVPVAKMLFTNDEIANNEFINARLAAEAGLPLPVVIDVAQEYDRLCAALLLEGLKDEAAQSSESNAAACERHNALIEGSASERLC
jgi:hypothetical protein